MIDIPKNLNPEHVLGIADEQKSKGWILEKAFDDGQLLFYKETDPIKKMVLIDPDTGLLNPSATSGNWTGGANAYSNNGVYTSNVANNGTQNFSSFGINLIGSIYSIDGIIIRVRARSNGTGTNVNANVRLSWNGGTSVTSNKNTGRFNGTSVADYDLGGAADTWGRSWSPSELSNDNFQVRVTNRASTGRSGQYDWIAAQVFYTQGYSVSLESNQDDSVSSNLGMTTFDSTEYTLPNSVSKPTGSYTALYTKTGSYDFSYWQVSGDLTVDNSGSNPCTATLAGSGSLIAIYTLPPGGWWNDNDLISDTRMNSKTLYVGSSTPIVTFPGMLWFNKNTDLFQQRNGANTEWLSVGGSSNSGSFYDLNVLGNFTLSGSAGSSGQVLVSSGSSATPSWKNLTSTDVGLGSVENIALSTWTGSSNIARLGTITTGVWNGSQITAGYLNLNSAAGTKTADLANLWTKGTKIAFADTSITKSDLGLGNVENTALSTWGGSSNITTIGTLSSLTTGYAYSGNTLLCGNWGSIIGNATSTVSIIANDTNSYKCLMIVGNTSSGSGRQVGIWDYLTVNGGMSVSSNIACGGTVDGVDISALLLKTSKVTDLGTIWDKTTKIAYGDTSFANQALTTTSTPTFGRIYIPYGDNGAITFTDGTIWTQKTSESKSFGVWNGSYWVGYITNTGDFWCNGNCSAASFTDHTPYYEGDAIKELSAIKGITETKEIDHSTLPEFVKVVKTDAKGKEVQERDLGAMISMLTVAIKQLNERLTKLENSGSKESEPIKDEFISTN